MASLASTPTLISSVPELMIFLTSFHPLSTLYLDIEGKSLGRHGTISLIIILIHPQKLIRLIDVLALGESAFTTASSGRTLQNIFEDPNISKCLWGVRNGADALWTLHHVGLAGVADIQLLENASRTGDKTYVRGLEKSLQLDLDLGFMNVNQWIQTKKAVVHLMAANIFASQLMDIKTIHFCAAIIHFLQELHGLYLDRIHGDWLVKVEQESERRVAEAHSPDYDHQSPFQELGPWRP